MFKKIIYFFLLFLTFDVSARPGLLEGLGLSDHAGEPPLVEEAFQFSAEVTNDRQLQVKWQVLDGNYLYRDKIQFEIIGNPHITLAAYDLPAGENKMDETFGLTEVYHHDTRFKLNLNRPLAAQTFLLKAHFQGCSETFGICYPPTSAEVSLALPAISADSDYPAISATETTPPIAEQDRIAQKLQHDNLFQIILGFIGLGLLLAFTPCVFPMIPILSSIIVGEGEHITTRRAFLLSLIYVLAMSVTYTFAGVLTGMLGQNLQAMFQNPWVIYSFSALFVILAASMFGLFELQLPHFLQHRLHQMSHRQQGGHLWGVALMGLLSGLIVGPCLAPPLAGALIFISQSADPVLGGIALFSLSIGMGLPLLIIGTSAGSLLPKAGNWMSTIKSIFGILLLGLAIWMLERIVPAWFILILWGALLIVSAVYMGALNTLHIDSSGWEKLWKGLGLLFLLYGAVLIVGGASGSHSLWQPLKALTATNTTAHTESGLKFTQIHNLAELKQHLQASQRPAILDFYADWCTDCKIIEKTTFQDPDIIKALSAFQLLQIDMTDNTAAHQALMKAYAVFGPPTMLFFDNNGQELSQYRLIGLVNAESLQQHVNKLTVSQKQPKP